MREQTQIVITLGYATQMHWLTIVREDIVDCQVVYAHHIFSFFMHPFYKRGGVGPVPATWRIF